MAKYTLWDIPTSTLLLDTDDKSRARQVAQLFVTDNGASILDELVLGVDDPSTPNPDNYSGEEIARELGLNVQVPETSPSASRSGH